MVNSRHMTKRELSSSSALDVARTGAFDPIVRSSSVVRSMVREGLSAEDIAIHEAVATILVALGLDIESEHFSDTPRRVAEALKEFCQPADLTALLKMGFENTDPSDVGAMVVQTDIPLRGMCAHHLLPFHGTTDIAYVPNDRIVGLSKMARVADAAGTIMPTTQEHLTNMIADTMQNGLKAQGVIVITSAVHTCMCVRGINKPGVVTRISAIRGLFRDSIAARAEALALMRTN